MIKPMMYFMLHNLIQVGLFLLPHGPGPLLWPCLLQEDRILGTRPHRVGLIPLPQGNQVYFSVEI